MGAAEFCWHAANQLIQKKLADMQADIALALQGCLRLGCMKEGAAAVKITSMMKRNSCGRCWISRGNGISDEFGMTPPGQFGGGKYQ